MQVIKKKLTGRIIGALLCLLLPSTVWAADTTTIDVTDKEASPNGSVQVVFDRSNHNIVVTGQGYMKTTSALTEALADTGSVEWIFFPEKVTNVPGDVFSHVNTQFAYLNESVEEVGANGFSKNAILYVAGEAVAKQLDREGYTVVSVSQQTEPVPAITNISGVPDTTAVNVPVNLGANALVEHYPVAELTGDNPITKADTDAQKSLAQSIQWSIVDAGETNALLDNGVLTAAASGTVTVKATIPATETGASEYTQTFSIDVKPALTITSLPATVTYGDTLFTLTVSDGTVTGDVVWSVTEGDDFASIDRSTGEVTIKAAGDVTIQASQGEAVAKASFTVNPKSITITALNQSIAKGQPIPPLTYSVEGLVGQDTLTREPTLTTDVQDTAQPGDYSITASDADAGSNYTISYQTGTLTISEAPIDPETPSLYLYVSTEPAENGTEVTAQVIGLPEGRQATVAYVDQANNAYTLGVTNAEGIVTAQLENIPNGQYQFTATFAGDNDYNPATATQTVTISDSSSSESDSPYYKSNLQEVPTQTSPYAATGDHDEDMSDNENRIGYNIVTPVVDTGSDGKVSLVQNNSGIKAFQLHVYPNQVQAITANGVTLKLGVHYTFGRNPSTGYAIVYIDQNAVGVELSLLISYQPAGPIERDEAAKLVFRQLQQQIGFTAYTVHGKVTWSGSVRTEQPLIDVNGDGQAIGSAPNP